MCVVLKTQAAVVDDAEESGEEAESTAAASEPEEMGGRSPADRSGRA